MTQDRTYWGQGMVGTWHAEEPGSKWPHYEYGAACGRSDWFRGPAAFVRADRIPPTAHLCGNCARIIAARTDIEEMVAYRGDVAGYGVTVAE